MFKILSSLLFLFCCSASKQARVCRAWMGPLPPWSLTRGGSLTLGSSALDVAERVDDARLLALLLVPLLDHKPNVKQFLR